MLKQMETHMEIVSGVKYYITPFPAFKAANLSGQLASVLAPLFSALLPLVGESNDFLNMDATKAAESIGNCTNIDGNKLEMLMRQLLLSDNIAAEIEDENGEKSIEKLSSDIVNELFCGNVQDMFVLCFHVIKINFNGFFKKLASQSGKATLEKASKRRIV